MTTIVSVRRGNQVVLGGDGQVSLGNTVMKGNARKVRRLYHDKVIAGFAGGTADAFTLFERFESQLEKHHGQLVRSAVELAKEWRSDRALRKLEAMLVVANEEASLIISGTGDVIEPEHGLIAIGSGAAFMVAQLLDVQIFDYLRKKKWFVAPLTSSLIGSTVDTFLFFSISFYATGIPWVTLSLGDLAVKIFVALAMLIPFRLLLGTLKPSKA